MKNKINTIIFILISIISSTVYAQRNTNNSFDSKKLIVVRPPLFYD